MATKRNCANCKWKEKYGECPCDEKCMCVNCFWLERDYQGGGVCLKTGKKVKETDICEMLQLEPV